MLRCTRLLTVACLFTLLGAGACSKSKPAAPTAPSATPAVTTTSLDAPSAQNPTGAQHLTDSTVILTIANAKLTGSTGEVKYRFQWSEQDSFPDDSRTGNVDDITQGGPETTEYRITDSLKPNFKYYWRAQGYAGTTNSDWSPTESFTTYNAAHCSSDPDIFDPLTDGRSLCGSMQGGHFIQGRGWQADNDTDGLNFDIQTCSNCTVEFDVTNFGKKEGENYSKDLKWMSMGDRTTFGDFTTFRNHPWKMHLEQRGDGDGTGMKMIWRNGEAGDDEPGDHTGKLNSGPNWNDHTVYHFIVSWFGGSGFSVKIGETQPDGSVTNLQQWFQDGFGGHPYAPPNMRVQLGCSARGETFFRSAIWSNLKIYKN